MANPPRPVMLIIMDGWGWREAREDNAVRLARTPNFDRFWATCPHALLRTSGLDVGLPAGQMGNSEVGHLNIGAGRVVMQDLPRISSAMTDGSFEALPAFTALVQALRASGGTCHLVGLVSPGGVHAHQDHALAIAKALAASGVPTLLHALTDGRDCPPRSAARCLRDLQSALPDHVRVATVSGRYYAMDRDHRWDRVSRAYLAIAEAQGPRFTDAASVIADAYDHDVTDEFIAPAVVGDYAGMRDGDALLCFNFRADRVRELLTAFAEPEFSAFARPRAIRFAALVGMTHYSDELSLRMASLFPPLAMGDLLGETVAKAGRRQLRMAETEKYPHVTYFLNGGREDPNPGEDRVLEPSPKVATYDLQPEMSEPALTRKALAAIGGGQYDLIILNFANADMVGHSGSLAAAIKAVEAVDAGMGALVDAAVAQGGAVLVTADHGNAELMRDPDTGGPHTAHTTNPVPAFLAGQPGAHLRDGRLADIAPTLLGLMQIPVPGAMTGGDLTR